MEFANSRGESFTENPPMKNIAPSIEILESRIAPASVFHYTDVDGDQVTITSSLGDLGAAGVVNVTAGQLQKLDLSDVSFNHANLAFSVVKVAGGNGLANVGNINGGINNFGNILVKGDLGQIDAGNNTTGTPAIKSLAVRSMGRLGLDTQGGVGNLESDIQGALGSLKVAGDVKDAFINVFGDVTATISSVTIRGSLIGGSGTQSGEIFSFGNMGPVKIRHEVQGGSGSNSGFISSGGTLARMTIGGSIIGGAGLGSGEISSFGNMGPVKIGHDVQGGSGTSSGFITTVGNLAGVTIRGSLIGGSNNFSGEIFSNGDMGAVKIGHDFTGGSITGSTSLDVSGLIASSGRIASVTIGGSIISGVDDSSGSLTNNASIRAANDIGSLTVAHSIFGNVNANGASLVVISARGQATVLPGATTDLAIGHITVGGRVEFANILAGYDINLSAVNGDAQIGAVIVGGDWAASNLVAGAMNAASGNTKFGDGNDASIGTGTPGIIAKIASIVIRGDVFGTPVSVNSTDHFGFVAEQIGLVKIGGNSIVLAANPQRVGETTDMTVVEV
jgi:hypothetical protein